MTIRNEAAPGQLAAGRGLLSWLWWILPVAEAVVLSLRIDTGSLAGNASWWAGLVAHGPAALSVVLISAAAGALIVWARAGGGKRPGFAQVAQLRPHRAVWPAAAGHFAALLLFVY